MDTKWFNAYLGRQTYTSFARRVLQSRARCLGRRKERCGIRHHQGRRSLPYPPWHTVSFCISLSPGWRNKSHQMTDRRDRRLTFDTGIDSGLTKQAPRTLSSPSGWIPVPVRKSTFWTSTSCATCRATSMIASRPACSRRFSRSFCSPKTRLRCCARLSSTGCRRRCSFGHTAGLPGMRRVF